MEGRRECVQHPQVGSSSGALTKKLFCFFIVLFVANMAFLHFFQSAHVLLMRSVLVLDLGVEVERLPLLLQHLAGLLSREVC